MAPKVLLTRPLPAAGQTLLQKAHDQGRIDLIKRDDDSTAPREWLLTQLRTNDVEGILCMLGDKIDEELIAAAGNSLKVVSTMSAGYDHIETAALSSRGIRLGTTPDALTDATADVGAMLALMASRRAGEGVRAVAEGKWPSMPWSPQLLCGHALQGVSAGPYHLLGCAVADLTSGRTPQATVGVLGFGKIGQLTLKRLLGFGIKRALYTTSRPGVNLDPAKDYFKLLDNPFDVHISAAHSLEHLASESDFVLVTCALTPSTRGIIDARFLSHCKPTSYIINTARGPVVNSQDLLEAVQRGQIAGAGLDVVDGEPNIGLDHPLVKERRIVVLPHIGSATFETRGEMARQSAVNVLAGVTGQEQWENEVVL